MAMRPYAASESRQPRAGVRRPVSTLDRLLSVVGLSVKRFALGPSGRRFGDGAPGDPLGGGEAGAETV